MLKTSQIWDIRCPNELKKFLSPRKGYWFKVDRVKAQVICDLLSAAYGIRRCIVQPDLPPKTNDKLHNGRFNGMYSAGRVWLHGRAHVKSVFHEWYHHLDHCTKGKYNSSDHEGGPTSYGWQFGDLVFAALKEPPTGTISVWAQQGLPKGHPGKE